MYVRTYVRMYVYVCMHVCMYVCTYEFMYLCMHVCMYACMYVRTYVRTYVCMYVCMYTYVCMYVYSCIYIYMAANQKHWPCNRLGRRQRFVTDGGVLRLHDKPLEDYSTLHRGPRQGFVTEGPRKRFVTGRVPAATQGFDPHLYIYNIVDRHIYSCVYIHTYTSGHDTLESLEFSSVASFFSGPGCGHDACEVLAEPENSALGQGGYRSQTFLQSQSREKKENQHKSSQDHIPTFWSLLQPVGVVFVYLVARIGWAPDS